ncbi:MAG TPA: hypothetical protein VGF02_04500 [Pseudolabrys sp.]
MNKRGMTRIAAVAAAAVVLFGVQHVLGLEFYVAFPVAFFTYLALLVAVGLLLDADKPAK